MRYVFRPAHPGAGPAVASGLPECMVAGREYDTDPGWAAHVMSGCPGIDGAPCLIPLDPPGAGAAREFLAAISTPTTINPETPPAAVSALAEPVKRKPGRKPRG